MLIALPAVIRVGAGSAAIEVAAHGRDAELLLGPYPESVRMTAAVREVL
jgi:hypothetical protein